jgi:hypothetical protein
MALILACCGNAFADNLPFMLDLSPYYAKPFTTAAGVRHDVVQPVGQHEFDGIPFLIHRRVTLYGKAEVDPEEEPDYPDVFGIPVERAFDELHLLHATMWTDIEGATVAVVRLNYADDTHYEYPIAYGVHVRDWQRLQSEEKERIADTDTKVVWRGPGMANFRSSQRIFKSMLENPFPDKVVDSVDLVSARGISSYDLYAATAVLSDPDRPVTPHVPTAGPARNFDGRVVVKVEDPEGRPIEGVWIYPNISVPERTWATVSEPFYTGPDGTGTSRYPKATSTCLVFSARKLGWKRAGQHIRFKQGKGLSPGYVVVIVMTPDPDTAPVPDVGSVLDSTNQAGVTGDPGEQTESSYFQDYTSKLFLVIEFPVGSRVRIEASTSLTSAEWTPVTTIDSLPFAPYPFMCEDQTCDENIRFYRAVLETTP